jgi:uncharacterized membrane protein YkoI
MCRAEEWSHVPLAPIVARTRTNMKSIHRSIGFALAVAAAATGLAFTASAEETHHAKVTLADARAKAMSLVAGSLVAEELEHENGRWIYSFEIKPTGEKGKLIKEVNIDADTGALVSIDTERD